MIKLRPLLFLSAVTLLFAGCEYESPLTTEHNIPIDSALLGIWENVPDSEKKSESKNEHMMVLKYSETEYLIHYPTGSDGIYYRGYPIKIGNVSCVQLEVVGTEDGPLDHKEKDLFHVASYEFKQDFLEVRLLNTDVVDDELKGTDALRKTFVENIDSKELFEEPNRFRKEEG